MQHFQDNDVLYQITSERSDRLGDFAKHIVTHKSGRITVEFEDGVRRPFSPGSLVRIPQATHVETAVPEPRRVVPELRQVVSPVRVRAARTLRTHNIVDEMNNPRPARVQIDQVVAAVDPRHDEGYETGDSKESLAMEAAIDNLTVAFTDFLRIANRRQRRHGNNRESNAEVQAMNIVRDLQFE